MLALAIVLAACASLGAQTGVAGSWRVEGAGPGFPWTAVLQADGSKLTGTVTGCGAPTIPIADGTIDGNTVSFNCKSPDGRVITFAGKISGDEIAFTWQLQGPPLQNNGLFGPSAPPDFTARRLNVITWTGTIQNVNGSGVVNAVKNQASVEIKKIADPHWRWRDVGDLTVATFIAGGSFELGTFVQTDQKVSYSFDRTQEDEPNSKDDKVQCELPRRADGAYEGNCSGGGFRRHVVLNPPAAPQSK